MTKERLATIAECIERLRLELGADSIHVERRHHADTETTITVHGRDTVAVFAAAVDPGEWYGDYGPQRNYEARGEGARIIAIERQKWPGKVTA